MDADILALAQDAAASLESQATSSPTDHTSLSPITLYRIGRVLFASISNGTADTSILKSFDKLISSLGDEYVRSVLLHELHVAYANLIVSFASSSISCPDTSSLSTYMGQTPNYATKPPPVCTSKDVIDATESLCGIYLASTSACEYCGSFESSSNELDIVFASFAWVYEYIASDPSIRIKENVLQTISNILRYGIVQTPTDKSEDEHLGSIMNIIQRIQSSGGEHNFAMGDMLQLQENANDSFVKALTAKFSNGPQLQYTLAMLRGFPTSNSKPAASNVKSSSKSKVSNNERPMKHPQQNMTDIQINHVKAVLPDLGDGFIEEALKVYNNDVERTLDALLQISDNSTNIHPRLRSLPKNLPRKLKDLPEQYTANVDMHRGATAKNDGKEHVQRQKQYIKQVERQAEEEAYLVENVSRALGGLRIQKNETDDFGITGNEYDDDYDDQYDGVGDDGGMAGGIGGMDEGLYDVDVHNVHQKYDRGGAKNEQEMWRQYNRLIKNVDAESQFWVSLDVGCCISLILTFMPHD